MGRGMSVVLATVFAGMVVDGRADETEKSPGTKPSVRENAGPAPDHRERPLPPPSAEDEARLRQELKEALQRRVDSLSVERLLEEVDREREAAREAEASNKLQRLREELGLLEKEFPGTAAADGAARMQGAAPATRERATSTPVREQATAPAEGTHRIETLPRGTSNLSDPVTHPLTLKRAAGKRHVAVSPRAFGVDPIIRGGINPDVSPAEYVITMTRGVSILITTSTGGHSIQLAADRAVIWTDAHWLDQISRGIEIDDSSRYQVYLEGNVVMTQGKNVLKGSSAYYDFLQQHGGYTNAADMTVPEYDATLRVRASLFRQKMEGKLLEATEGERVHDIFEEAAKDQEKNGPAPQEVPGTDRFGKASPARIQDARRKSPGAPFIDPIPQEGEKAGQETKPGGPL